MPNNWNIKEILFLTYLNGFTSNQLKNIIEEFDCLEEFLQSDSAEAIKLSQGQLFEDGLSTLRNNAEMQSELCWQNGIQIINLWDNNYPPLLKEITYPPFLLFVKGNLLHHTQDSISIVGTRRCTHYGRHTAEKFAEVFAQNDIIVTSGLAYGVDTYSHLAAIKAGGITYAVIASGIDCILPFESKKNADRILESGGAIISEYKCDIKAMPGFFPQRNRIISGLSRATVVIESAEKGGSLITARFAFDQGREVFAVPGEIYSEKSKGTNILIKKNIAQIAVSPESVLEELNLLKNKKSIFEDYMKNININSDESKLLEILNHKPMHIDEILNISGLEMSVILVKLLELEFKNLVKQLPGKYYIKE